MRKHFSASLTCPELSNFSCRKVLVTERSEPLRAGDFVLRTTSVSTLDLDKGQRPLTPRRMLTHSSVSWRIKFLLQSRLSPTQSIGVLRPLLHGS